ncbi:hypothetical protein Syun_000698 [Stephania yunnanensis]|uniref:Acyl-CoA-binding domain-containing protein n=1 Tax=Stephania yunnanensis TaxID=152371 RepID=A0AAP0LDL3_9MAGN
MEAAEIGEVTDVNEWILALPYYTWVALPVSGSRPPARYKHGSVVAKGKLYVIGGSRNGRNLADIQVLDLKTLAWSTVKLHADPNSESDGENRLQEVFPAVSGCSVISWANKLIFVGGYSREPSNSVTVRVVDLESYCCSTVKTLGPAPIARGGQSVTLVGSRLIMFGGESRSRKLLNDVHFLDLETMRWNEMETLQNPPEPRFDHIATVHADRYLIIFGGSSHSTCFSDIHILDLETMEWSRPHVQGAVVTPRAGHAGNAIGENWYIIGGGDNKGGSSETLVLNKSKLVLSVLTSVNEKDPLASEGLSLCSASLVNGDRVLVTFGGYNGNYANEVFVLRLKPKDTSRPKIFQSPAAAAAAASVSAAYALTKTSEIRSNVDVKEDETTDRLQTGNPSQNLENDINTITAVKKNLEILVAEAREDNSRIRGKLDEMNKTHVELSKELISVRSQLSAEESRCFKLEAQITELSKILSSHQSIEDELQKLRSQKPTEFYPDRVTKRQSSGGGTAWRWLGGTPDT